MTFTLYIEGGGDNRRLAAQFREGWTRFLAAAGLSGHMPRVVRGGSREQTFKQFTTEVARPVPGTLPLLLVDSEVPVVAEHSFGSICTHMTVGPDRRAPATMMHF